MYTWLLDGDASVEFPKASLRGGVLPSRHFETATFFFFVWGQNGGRATPNTTKLLDTNIPTQSEG